MQNNWLINSYKQHLSYAHQKSNPFDFKSIILRQRDITCLTLYDITFKLFETSIFHIIWPLPVNP